MRNIYLIAFFLGALNARADCGLPLALANFEQHGSRARALIRPTLERCVDDCLNRYKDETRRMFSQAHDTLATVLPSVSTGTNTYMQALNAARLRAVAATRAGTDQARAQFEAAALRERIGVSGETLKAVIDRTKAQLAPHEKAIRDNDSNLTRYGFVLSDRMASGSFAYPNCNSQRNDRPAETWVEFRENFYKLSADLNRLQAAVDCQLRETGATL